MTFPKVFRYATSASTGSRTWPSRRRSCRWWTSGLQTEFPLLRTLDAIPNNLPKLLTSFVGRDRELAEAVRLLGLTRILTFTGPGGTGKTRLSLQVAAEVADDYPDGVFFVDLAPVVDADLIPSRILETLGIQVIDPR